jgi:hypothetical protein
LHLQERKGQLVVAKDGAVVGLNKLIKRLMPEHTTAGSLVVLLPVQDNELLLAQNLQQSLQQHVDGSKQRVMIFVVLLAPNADCQALQTPTAQQKSSVPVVCASVAAAGESERAVLHVAAAFVGELGHDVLLVNTASACTADVVHTVTSRSEDLLVMSELSTYTAGTHTPSVVFVRSSGASAQLLRQQADSSSSSSSSSSGSSSSGGNSSSSSSWTDAADQLQLTWGLFDPLTVMQGYGKLSSTSPLLDTARTQHGVELALVVSPPYSELAASARAGAQQAYLQREGLWHLEHTEQAAAADVLHSVVAEEPEISAAVLRDVAVCRQLDRRGLLSSAVGGGQCTSSSGVRGMVTLTLGEAGAAADAQPYMDFAVQLSSETPLCNSTLHYQLQLVLDTGVVPLGGSVELKQQPATATQQSAAKQYTGLVHVSTDYTAYLLQGPAVITLELQAGKSLLRCVMCRPAGSSGSLTVTSNDAGSDSAALWDIVEVQDDSSAAAGSAQRKDLSREAAIEQGCYVPYMEEPRAPTAEKTSKQHSSKKTKAAGRGKKRDSSSSMSSRRSGAMQKVLNSKPLAALRKAAAALTAGVIAAAVIRALAAFAAQH